jgi:sarcosine oxidase
MSSATSNTYDVAVVGAGVFGAWIALVLRRSGRRVVLIDQYGAGNSRSSSGGESRIIRLGYGDDEIYTRSAQRSLNRWLEFAAETGEQIFQPTGVLWLAHDDDPYPEKTWATLTRAGVPLEKLTPSELETRYPQLTANQVKWAMLETESGALMARRAVQAVARQAVYEGADYVQDTVTLAAPLDRFEWVTTRGGEKFVAQDLVFACGPWLPKVFPNLLAARIITSRQEIFFFGPAQDTRAYSAGKLPIWIDFKDEAYGFPDLENRGVKIAIDRHGPPFDPDTGERVVTSAGLHEVRRYLARRMPALANAPVIETRVCQYENTSNGDFLIDQHPHHPNVWLVGGGSGHGFKHGPDVAQYVLARLDGNTEGIEPRFSLASKQTSQQRSVF